MVAMKHPHLTSRAERIFWKGVEVEHVNCDSQESFDWAELIERCQHIESLGLVPRAGTVVWHWEWFESMPYDSVYREFLGHTPGFWEHGCTEEMAAKKSAANCGPCAVVEPDGSIAVSYRGQVVTWDAVQALPLKLDQDLVEHRGIYHALQAVQYNAAQMGQPIHNGPCYATYDMVEAWLDSHAVDLGGTIALMRALDLR